MSPENQADHEVVPAARFVETSRSVRLPTDGTGSSIMVAVLRRDLLPSTGNSELPKNEPAIPRANPFASNVATAGTNSPATVLLGFIKRESFTAPRKPEGVFRTSAYEKRR